MRRYLAAVSLLCFSAPSIGEPVNQSLVLGYVDERCGDVKLGDLSAVAPPGFKISPQAIAAGLRYQSQCSGIRVEVHGGWYRIFYPDGTLFLIVNGSTGRSIGIRH